MENEKKMLEDFLKEFQAPWYSIDEPAKLLEKYFEITKEGVVGLRLYWDMCLYIGKISDVSLEDVHNVVNTVKILVNNYLNKWEQKPKQNLNDGDESVLVPA